ISSAKLPSVTSRAFFADINAAGRDFFIAAKPAAATRFRTWVDSSVSPAFSSFGKSSVGAISSKRTGIPAFAKCASIAAPIVPAPTTAAFLMIILLSIVFRYLNMAIIAEPRDIQQHARPLRRIDRFAIYTHNLHTY